jgi:hypothetical protein
MNTDTKTPIPTIEQALAFADGKHTTGGAMTQMTLDALAAEVRRQQVELAQARAENDRLTGMAEEEVAKRAKIVTENERLTATLAQRDADNEAEAAIDADEKRAMKAKIAALVAAGDAMLSSSSVPTDVKTWLSKIRAWDAAKSGAPADVVTKERLVQMLNSLPEMRANMLRYSDSLDVCERAELAELRADKARLDSRCIKMTFPPDEWGHTSCIHHDIDLRARIDAAREATK